MINGVHNVQAREWKSYTFLETQSATMEEKTDNTETSKSIRPCEQHWLHGVSSSVLLSPDRPSGELQADPQVCVCAVSQFPSLLFFLNKHHQQIEKKHTLKIIMFATNAIFNSLICNATWQPMSFVFTRSPLNCSFPFRRHSDCLRLMKSHLNLHAAVWWLFYIPYHTVSAFYIRI